MYKAITPNTPPRNGIYVKFLLLKIPLYQAIITPMDRYNNRKDTINFK